MGNFYTDVICNDSRFDSTNRIDDLALLETVTRQLVLMIIQQAANMGFDMMVFETYRSQARQQQLFQQGATQLRQVGVHHYGLACDIVKKVNGEPSWKGDFSFMGQLAHSAGLIWGGDWGTPNQHTTSSINPRSNDALLRGKGTCSQGVGIRIRTTTLIRMSRTLCWRTRSRNR
jgi:hypothetical protein